MSTPLGKHIATGVEDLGHPLIDHVRGAGLLLGIVLTETVGPAAALAAREAGFIINAPAADVLRLAPPLILTTEQADSFIAALPGILDTASRRPEAETTMHRGISCATTTCRPTN